ncbi:MAG: hypothetical protein HY079_10320 [Elusimicrobia bacterium]|nr:hypothetical protein [Elusimicrobiota bacterium]
MKSLVIDFLVGGTVTALIVRLEESGLRTWSGVAALMPVFTLVSYFIIGESQGGLAVAKHSQFVLAGTVVSWIPYMLVIALLAPRLGANRAIGIGLGVFFALATAFVLVVEKYRLFR